MTHGLGACPPTLDPPCPSAGGVFFDSPPVRSVGDPPHIPSEASPPGVPPGPPDPSGGAGPLALTPSETTAQMLLFRTRFGERAHRPHAGPRERIMQALASDGGDDLAKRAMRLSQCCSMPWLVVRAESGVGISCARCRDRACPLCQGARARETAARAETAIREMDSTRFLTLTVRSNDDSLRDRLKHLRQSFGRLRRTKTWLRHVRGGIYTIEITYNASTKQWHPHLHALVDGAYFPHATLVAAWREATTDSDVVDIRAIYGAKSAARYVAKYATKPAEIALWPRTRIAEWARAIHGSRLIAAFGALHGVNLDPADPNESPDEVQRIAPLIRLDHELRYGTPGVWGALQTLCAAYPPLRSLYPAQAGTLNDQRITPPPEAIAAAIETLGNMR